MEYGIIRNLFKHYYQTNNIKYQNIDKNLNLTCYEDNSFLLEMIVCPFFGKDLTKYLQEYCIDEYWFSSHKKNYIVVQDFTSDKINIYDTNEHNEKFCNNLILNSSHMILMAIPIGIFPDERIDFIYLLIDKHYLYNDTDSTTMIYIRFTDNLYQRNMDLYHIDNCEYDIQALTHKSNKQFINHVRDLLVFNINMYLFE